MVYLPKPALNLLKTWFSREKPAEMSSKLVYEGLDKRCKPVGFIDKNLPKTWIKPGLRLIKPGLTATNQV
jgi:hypothetical protein